MKKISFIILTISIFFVIGCHRPSYYFERDIYTSQIIKIELRYSEPPSNPKNIKYKDDDVPIFHLSDTSLVETLDEDDIRVFCVDLSYVQFHKSCDGVKKPFGYIIVMYLANGNYIIYSQTKYNGGIYYIFAEFDSEEKFVKCFGFLDTDSYYFDIMCRYFKSYNITSFYDL